MPASGTPLSPRTTNTLPGLLDVIAIGLKLNKDASKQWFSLLKDHTHASAIQITSEDWLAKQLPLRVLSELRRIPLKADPSQLAPIRNQSMDDFSAILPKSSTEENKDFGNNSLRLRKKKRHGISTAKSKSVNLSSLRRKLPSSPTVDEELLGIPKIKLLGKSEYTNALLQQYLNVSNVSDIPRPVNTSVNCFGKEVNMEVYNYGTSHEFSVLVLVFAKNNVRSLTELLDKYLVTINKYREIQIPVILVGVIAEIQGAKYATRDLVMEICEELNALRYFDVTARDHAADLFYQIGMIACRDSSMDVKCQIDVVTKIAKVNEKKLPELTLRKKGLSMLPNAFLYCTSYLQRIRLDNNNFKQFPEEVLFCPVLRELCLSMNQIEEIPSGITKLTTLIKLDMENNQLNDIPIAAITKLNHLQDLRLGGNPLKKVPAELKKGKEIKLENILAYKPDGSLSDSSSSLLQHSDSTPPTTPLVGHSALEYILIDRVQKEPERATFKVYGVPLGELMANEYKLHPDIPVPRIARRAFQFIYTNALLLEGIFRLAGQNLVCIALREEIDTLAKLEFREDMNAHNVTSLIKQWLRCLPEPVMLFSNYEKAINLKESDDETQLAAFKEMLATLPRENYHLIRQLCRLMYIVGINAESNRMDFGNVAKVIGPNLLFPRVESDDPHLSISNVSTVNDLFQLTAQYYPELFEHGQDLFAVDYLQDEPQQDSIFYRKLTGHTKSIIALQLSSDLKLIWSADSSGSFRIWDAQECKLVSRFDTTKKRINCLSRHGNNMWMGTIDSLQIRNEITGDLVKEINGVKAYHISIVNNKVWIADDGVVCSYDPETYELEKIELVGCPLLFAVFGDKVWGSCVDRKIRVWNVDTLEVVTEIDASGNGRLNSITTISGHIWGTFDNGNICIWNCESYELINTLEGQHKGKVFGCTKVGEAVWTYAWDGMIQLYHHATHEYIRALPVYTRDAIGAIECTYDESKQCYIVFTASWDKTITVWLSK